MLNTGSRQQQQLFAEERLRAVVSVSTHNTDKVDQRNKLNHALRVFEISVFDSIKRGCFRSLIITKLHNQ